MDKVPKPSNFEKAPKVAASFKGQILHKMPGVKLNVTDRNEVFHSARKYSLVSSGHCTFTLVPQGA